MERKIAITKAFFKKMESYQQDFRKIIKKQFELLIEYGETYPSLNFEKLYCDGDWYSIRINQRDRAILKVKEDLIYRYYIFHMLGEHKIEEKINIKEHQIFKEGINNIFEGMIDNLLEKINEPEYSEKIEKEKKEEILAIAEKQEPYSPEVFKKYLPEMMKLTNQEVDTELINKINNANNKDEILEILCDANNDKLFDLYSNNEKIYFFSNQAEFENIANAKLKDWMLFLHKNQLNIVTGEFKGPVRVRGVVGSGKTTVAIHRAKYLIKEKFNNKDEKVLFFVFNNALMKAIKELLEILLPNKDDRERVEVTTLHHWAEKFLTESGYNINITGQEFHKYFEEAKKCVKDSEKIRINIEDEINYFIKGFNITKSEEYLYRQRKGAVERLSVEEKNIIFNVYNKYNEFLKENSLMDFNDCIIQAINEIIKNGLNQKYCALIVDEVQDFKWIDMKLIKIISDKLKYGKGFLMLVGDFQQKIYKASYTFDSVGINIVGRSKVLYKNYRNTREIFGLARELVKDILEGKINDNQEIQQMQRELERLPDIPLISGEVPEFVECANQIQEAKWVVNKIDKLINNKKYLPGEIAIFFRYNKYIQYIKNELNKRTIKYLNNFREYDEEIFCGDKIKLITLHSAKGLEFKVVFIVGVGDGIIPFFKEIEESGEQGIIREKLLLYVGITRAVKELYLSYYKLSDVGLKYKPSRFLEKISDKYLKRVKV